MIIEIVAILALVILDQGTKLLAIEHLKPLAEKGDSIQIINGVFELYYTENRGAAFSLFDNNPLILAFISMIIIVVVIIFKRQIPRTKHYKLLHILSTLIIAGAFGNLIDRLRLQFVVDFFHFYWFEFPIFNVADILITCSAGVLIVLLFTKYKDLDF